MEKDKKTKEEIQDTQIQAVNEHFEDSISEREKILEQTEIKLHQREESLNERENALHEREKLLHEKEQSLLKEEEPAPETHTPVEFSFGEEKFRFRASAPALIRILGEVKTQEQIAKDEDLILHLVGGNSGLIEHV